MLKKIATAITTTALASQLVISNTYAENTQATEKQIKQIQQLQDEINQLQNNVKDQKNPKLQKGELIPINEVVYGDNYADTYLEQYSSSLRALSLLQARDKFRQGITLGGRIEMVTQTWWGSDFRQADGSASQDLPNNGSGIFLTDVNLDTLANIGDWTQIYLKTNTAQSGSSFTTQAESAFVTIGNLQKSSYFITAGKDRPAFGTFPGAPWSSSIEQGLFRPSYINNLTVGYDNLFPNSPLENLNVNLTYVTPSGNTGTLLASAFYQYTVNHDLSIGGNIGYMSDINATGASISQTPNSSNTKTPVANIEGNVVYKDVTLYSGWTSTMRDNSNLDPSGGKSGVWYVQSVYQPSFFTQVTQFSIAYSQSYNMSQAYFPAAANAGTPTYLVGPKRQFYAFVTRNVFSSVVLSLEYAWLQTYSGKINNEVTLDSTIYF